MAVQADFDRQRQLLEQVLWWLLQYCVMLRSQVNCIIEHGFGAPGGGAEGARRMGFQGALIDWTRKEKNRLGDPRKWFGDMLLLYLFCPEGVCHKVTS